MATFQAGGVRQTKFSMYKQIAYNGVIILYRKLAKATNIQTVIYIIYMQVIL